MTPAILFENVFAGYRKSDILKDLSFSIPPGSITAILGPNGAGKTTCLRVAGGLLIPYKGHVKIKGEPVQQLSAKQRATCIGVVPQFLDTPVPFRVSDFVMNGRVSMLSRWGKPSREDWEAVEQAMVYTDVIDMKNRMITELSGGEKQRVIIAMVVAQNPEIILLDEATSHLDINHRLEIMQLLEQLNHEHGKTVVMISHDLNMAAEFANDIILLQDGQKIADGPPVDVLTEENLQQVYDCNVRVDVNRSTGAIHVLPNLRMTRTCGYGKSVHVIAGGGSGEEILRRLRLCGFEVSCGVLNEGDVDAEAAAALNVKASLVAPFEPVSGEALEQARAQVMAADSLILADVPFGPGNIANLDLVQEALDREKAVFVVSCTAERDYTETGVAKQRLAGFEGRARYSTVTLSQIPAFIIGSDSVP